MKANSSFPHPVLGVGNGVLTDIAESEMLEIVDVVEKRDTYEYTFQLNQDNRQITDYIKDGFAEYVCELDCNKTLYKSTCHSQDSRLVVTIKKKDVAGHIDFSFFVVTTKKIVNYQNKRFNNDYRDPDTEKMPSFNIETGGVLVMFPQWSDNVNTRFNNKPELNAFVQVVKRNDADKTVDFDFSEDVVNIKLPEEMYYDFLEYNRDQYKGLFYTSLIFNALVKAILNISKNDVGQMWIDAIKAIIEATPEKYQGLDLEEPADAVDIATLMLSNQEYGTPYDLLFMSVKNLQN